MSNPIHGLNGVHFCGDAQDTRMLGWRLGEAAFPGLVVALDGPLGAGKTEFVKGLAEGLGCADAASSPTFAIAHQYPGGRFPLHHFDFYRIESEEELLTCGFEELSDDGVVAVEWAVRFSARLPRGAVWVRIEIPPSGGRVVTIG